MIQRIIEKADVKHPVDADKILKEIKNYDIVSFDIFDTLLKRNVKEPTDVFSYMEKKYQINGFREKRIEAEKAARKKKNGLEISLEDIYAEFGADYSDKKNVCKRQHKAQRRYNSVTGVQEDICRNVSADEAVYMRL